MWAILLHLQLELAAVGLLLVGAALRLAGPRRQLGQLGRLVARLGCRPLGAPALCAALALAGSIVVSVLRPPVPSVHDEFAYLLAADTFAHGRLTNPTPAHWHHFETIHVLQQPSYASKYPPGQGLLLALGQRLAGHPIVGVWLGTASAAAALCWMLAGWLPRRWALVGGLLFALQPNLQLGWGQSYWGAAPVVLGSALLFGAVGRLRRRRTGVVTALVAGLGFSILLSTRPYEGLLAGAVAAWLVLAKLGFAQTLRRVVPGAACVVLPVILATLHYHASVTGDPWRVPYEVHERSYAIAPIFVWQSPREAPQYRHRTLERFHTEWSMEAYRAQRTWSGLLRWRGNELLGVWLYLLGPLLSLPLVCAGCGPTTRLTWGAAGLLLTGALLVTWLQPHYLAAALPLLLLLVATGLRRIHAWRRDQRSGALWVAAFLALYALNSVAAAARFVAHESEGWGAERARIVRLLESEPGDHLVLVSYGRQHDPLVEWVYNAADLESARIVWARTLGREADRALLQHFRQRTVWRLHSADGKVWFRRAADLQEPREEPR